MRNRAALQACFNDLRDISPAPEETDALLDAATQVCHTLGLNSPEAVARHRVIADAYVQGLPLEVRTQQLGRTKVLQSIALGLAGAAATLSYPARGGDWSVIKPKPGHPRARNKARKKAADKSRRRNRK